MNKEKWDEENIPDQTGKIVIVTGASSGIGFEAAKALANKHAEVIIAVRNPEKGESAKRRIIEQNKIADVKVLQLDLTDLQSVKTFAGNFKKKYLSLNILINNAGVMTPPYTKTADGFELQMGTNHFGHFALTGQLFSLLKSTKGARIVTVSSGLHKSGRIDFDDLNWEKRKYPPMQGYRDSKLANLYFTHELDKKTKENNLDIIAVSAHPGMASTDLARNSGLFIKFIVKLFAQNSRMGALPTLRAAFDANAAGGEYYGPGGLMTGYPVINQPGKLSKDEIVAKKLWEVSERLTGVKFDFAK
ncbi:MAG: oxidoreductase [Ignavibacteriaceae bacterium]|nr:oxidoreductase [Ignavibacteriaceae bacterium]